LRRKTGATRLIRTSRYQKVVNSFNSSFASVFWTELSDTIIVFYDFLSYSSCSLYFLISIYAFFCSCIASVLFSFCLLLIDKYFSSHFFIFFSYLFFLFSFFFFIYFFIYFNKCIFFCFFSSSDIFRHITIILFLTSLCILFSFPFLSLFK